MTALLGTDRIGDAQHRVASGGYFATMHIPLRRGRTFQESDGPDNPHVAVISESLARRYFQTPIRSENRSSSETWMAICICSTSSGSWGTSATKRSTRDPQPTIYVNHFQRGSLQIFPMSRSQSDVTSLISAMRREAQRANPEMPIKFETLEQLVSFAR
jgi:hypothetical protein